MVCGLEELEECWYDESIDLNLLVKFGELGREGHYMVAPEAGNSFKLWVIGW